MPAPASPRRKPYRVAELAEMWDIDQSTIYRMIYAGRLRAERHGPRGGAIRVTAEAAAAYLEAAACGAVA